MEIIFQSVRPAGISKEIRFIRSCIYNKKLISFLFYTIKNIFSTIPFGVIKEKIVI